VSTVQIDYERREEELSQETKVDMSEVRQSRDAETEKKTSVIYL
jgi:hypothetical protein